MPAHGSTSSFSGRNLDADDGETPVQTLDVDCTICPRGGRADEDVRALVSTLQDLARRARR